MAMVLVKCPKGPWALRKYIQIQSTGSPALQSFLWHRDHVDPTFQWQQIQPTDPLTLWSIKHHLITLRPKRDLIKRLYNIFVFALDKYASASPLKLLSNTHSSSFQSHFNSTQMLAPQTQFKPPSRRFQCSACTSGLVLLPVSGTSLFLISPHTDCWIAKSCKQPPRALYIVKKDRNPTVGSIKCTG